MENETKAAAMTDKRGVKVRRLASDAAAAMAHLYAWEAVVSILVSATPDRQDAKARSEVQRVIRIARSETRRMLGIYDKHIAALSNVTSKGDASNG